MRYMITRIEPTLAIPKFEFADLNGVPTDTPDDTFADASPTYEADDGNVDGGGQASVVSPNPVAAPADAHEFEDGRRRAVEQPGQDAGMRGAQAEYMGSTDFEIAKPDNVPQGVELQRNVQGDVQGNAPGVLQGPPTEPEQVNTYPSELSGLSPHMVPSPQAATAAIAVPEAAAFLQSSGAAERERSVVDRKASGTTPTALALAAQLPLGSPLHFGEAVGSKPENQATVAAEPRTGDFSLRGRLVASVILIVGILTGVQVWAVAGDERDIVAEWAAYAGFRVAEVYVFGRQETPPEELRQALGVEKDMPIFAIDLDGARQRVENLGWIEAAVIERHLPAVLHVRLKEREPIAVWQTGGHLSLIDHEGNIIADAHGTWLKRLPHVVGNGAERHASAIIADLSGEADLWRQTVALVRVSDRRWDVIVEAGFRISLPEENHQAAWKRAAELLRERRLPVKSLKLVDFRVPGRIFLQTEAGEVHPVES